MRLVRLRYSVTTIEPGAKLVFTKGLVWSPASTAFLATSPAARSTDGLLVFVQLVIAAMATSPWRSSVCVPSSSVTVAVLVSSAVATSKPRSFTGALRLWSQARWTSERAMRSCGRLGPAMLASTVERSSSSTSWYSGSGVSSVRNRFCSFA